MKPRPFPRPHHHKRSGQARLCYRRRHYYLGPWGSPEAAKKYAELHARLEGGGLITGPAGATVAEVIAAFKLHADRHYRRPDGTPTNEVSEFERSWIGLVALYGERPAAEVGPLMLKTARQQMIDTGLCRRVINQRVGRLKRLFRWAAENEIVPATVYQALASVRGLQVGRTAAKDHPEVPPVAEAVVDATVGHLGPVTRAMVRLQQYTGMRPGEVCSLRPMDVDQVGVVVGGVRVWVFRPPQHKTSWRGHKKAVAIGPKGQLALRPFLDRPADAWCFSPAEEMQAHRGRVVKRGKRRMGKRYTAGVYAQRIRQVCLREGIEPWSPNQLRHLAAGVIEHGFGLDAARAALGHRNAQTTLIYAARDLGRAAEVAAKIG